MNREFVSKMIKAKKMEWEAIQELFPDKLKTTMDEMGDMMKGFAKEFMIELYFSAKAEHQNPQGGNEEKDISKGKSSQEQKNIKKVTIE